jgi:TrmH family RNA methyltransferase
MNTQPDPASPPPALENLRIVLVGTTHPGNIGATARAMKTMGLRRLVLVEPHRFPCMEATARASGADDILAQATVCASLEQALQGARLVFGTSARPRSIAWPTLAPDETARHAQAVDFDAAIVFGREHSGLSNEELEQCHYLVQIPSVADFSSLNLAAAAQILCYELRRTWLAGDHAVPGAALPKRPSELPVDAQAMRLFYAHLERTLIDLDFLDPDKPKRLMRRLHRLFNRVELNESEYNILRGVFTAAQAAVKKAGK